MSEMTPEQIKAEIAEARRMVREDKLLASHTRLQAKLDKHFPDEPAEPPEGAPPAPEPHDPEPPKKPTSKWWGDI